MKVNLRVEGMTCQSCEELIKESLTDLPGIKNVSVSKKSSNVSVNYDENQVTQEKIIAVIKEEGYNVCK